jgi:hypothetical protein
VKLRTLAYSPVLLATLVVWFGGAPADGPAFVRDGAARVSEGASLPDEGIGLPPPRPPQAGRVARGGALPLVPSAGPCLAPPPSTTGVAARGLTPQPRRCLYVFLALLC